MKQGNIGVTTENIFPVIKKFLYSDHEIFIREIVSNAVDATQKLKTLAGKGDFKGELGELKVTVSVDKEAKTITVSDRGIGMTADEIEKYINQIAFSGANDFLDKYKDDANAIIGHFGLGFYSSYMVSKQVDIITKSYQEDAPAVKWSCDGSPVFTMEEVEYTPDGHTKEGGNPCQISWQGKDKHTLSYQYNGHTNTENWHRTAMPAHVVSIFK